MSIKILYWDDHRKSSSGGKNEQCRLNGQGLFPNEESKKWSQKHAKFVVAGGSR